MRTEYVDEIQSLYHSFKLGDIVYIYSKPNAPGVIKEILAAYYEPDNGYFDDFASKITVELVLNRKVLTRTWPLQGLTPYKPVVDKANAKASRYQKLWDDLYEYTLNGVVPGRIDHV